MKALRKWYARNFQIITIEQAVEWDLEFLRNVYGDEINHLSSSKKLCRSIWKDAKNKQYRIDVLGYDYIIHPSEPYISGVDPSTDSGTSKVGI